jgi:formimidoylglutamate deiminase
MTTLFTPYAFLPDGWANHVCIEIDSTGTITAVTSDVPELSQSHAIRLTHAVLPGIPNLHSHAFQWAMAGLAERAGAGNQTDSFWSWRQIMYRFVDRLTPDQLEVIATYLYIQMLKAGFTSVAEFHYLHHDPTGQPYARISELSARLVAAAEVAGIGLTLLPVIYAYSNFGAQPPTAGQRRFVTTPDQMLQLWQELRSLCRDRPTLRLGIAPHSLRATTPELLQPVLTAIESDDPTAPIHLHIAEQSREVEDCLAWCGQRPVQWAMEHLPISSRWCLVHATHVTPEECQQMRDRGVVVGLCLTTEANLGDGIFPAVDYLKQSGKFGIGSDSHISVNPIEELRWLEYGQRLQHQRRNLLCNARTPSVGEFLYRGALLGGAQALGQPIGQIQPGYRADLLVLDLDSPAFIHANSSNCLDQLIFATNHNPIRDVMVAGSWVVRAQQHPHEAEVGDRYRQALKQLEI